MKKKIMIGALAALFLSVGIFTATNLQEKKQVSGLTLANIEAMTGCESSPNSHSGWLYCKHWSGCQIAGQIIVTQAGGSFTVGVVHPSGVGIEAQITATGGKYTIVSGGQGLKSYCFDGWGTCSADGCM